MHCLSGRTCGVYGSTGAPPAPVRPSVMVSGDAVIRSSVKRLNAAFRPNVVPIADSRPELQWSTFSFPRSRPNRKGSSRNCLTKAGTRLLLSDLVGEQDVLLGMQADRKRSALSGIAARLAEKAGRRHGAVLAALLRRERLGPTAVGNGIAIPHARLDGISAPAAVLAVLQRPVPFGMPDDDPVDLLLALLWPPSDTKGFVPALHGVSRRLRSSGLRDLLQRSRTPAEARAWIETFEKERLDRPGQPPAEPRRHPDASGGTAMTGSADPLHLAARHSGALNERNWRLH